jgi:hypothetical protein
MDIQEAAMDAFPKQVDECMTLMSMNFQGLSWGFRPGGRCLSIIRAKKYHQTFRAVHTNSSAASLYFQAVGGPSEDLWLSLDEDSSKVNLSKSGALLTLEDGELVGSKYLTRLRTKDDLYIRHSNYRLRADKQSSSDRQWKLDSSWFLCLVPADSVSTAPCTPRSPMDGGPDGIGMCAASATVMSMFRQWPSASEESMERIQAVTTVRPRGRLLSSSHPSRKMRSDDSGNDLREKTVTGRASLKRKLDDSQDVKPKAKGDKPLKAVAGPKSDPKPQARRARPARSPNELVKFAKKEGTTRFHQMRVFLEKANQSDKPVDLLAGFLSSRRSPSPARSRRSSADSRGSPRMTDFHTGLTPTSVERMVASPKLARRDSDDFAWDLDATDDTAANKVGSFIHGQRSLNLRHKMKTVGAGDNLSLALLMDDIPDMEKTVKALSRAQMRDRLRANTAEDEEDQENAPWQDESQSTEDELLFGV